MPIKIRFIKDCDCGKIGEIQNYSNNSAHSLVEEGYAEYLEEQQNKPKKIIPKQLINCNFNRVRFKEKKAFEIEWQNKPYSYDGIQKYFPKENYGVICGSDLRVLDDDTSDKKLIKLFINEFGKTFRVRDHLYFKFDNGYSKKMILFGENKNHLGEVQGENTYVVGAGSTHPSGELYELKEDLPIIEISYDKFIEVFKNYIPSNDFNVKEADIEQGDEEIINELLPKWNEGNRQNLTLNLAGYLRKNKGFGFKHTQQIIQEICRRTGDLDLTERLNAVKETYFKDEEEIKGVSGLKEQEIILETESFLIPKFDKKGEFLNYVVNIDKVAEFIENKYQIRTIFGIKEETIEVYDKGIWSVKGRGVIKAEIEILLGVNSKNHVVQEILEKIKRRTEISREEADEVPDYKRCLENGVLDLEDVNDIKIIPHSKEYNFRTKFPITYNPEANCPEIIKFMNETFDEDDLLKIQEWFGFHLPRRYFKKKFAIIYGEKHTGKTIVLNLLTKFVGGNVSGLSLQEISKGKPFDLLSLKDKDANIHDDLNSQDMRSVGGIKKSVGDGFIDGEMKFGDRCKFRNTAKQTYSCNKIPASSEDIDDDAYYDRILLFLLEHIVPKNEQDDNLLDKLTTPEELSGLLNWAIEGYKRIVKQNGFSNEKEPEEIKFLMIKGGNSLAEFSSEVLQEEAGAKITKDDLYKVYCQWCLEHKPKLSPISKEKIGRKLITLNPYVQSSKSGNDRYWLNLNLKGTWDTFKKNMSNYSESSINSNNSIIYNKNDTKIDTYIFSRTVPTVPFLTDKQDKTNLEKTVPTVPNSNTNDTFLEKENDSLELNFEESGI